jgi:polyhydroxybutyrate depolymerase
MKALSILSFILITLSTFVQAQQKTEHFTIDGHNREFITYLPAASNQKDKMPVIISLHGRLGTAVGMVKFADFRPIADREKVIIVCPQGINRSWNDGRQTPANGKGINDVKFIDSLISYIIRNYDADASRVYVTGMSNGGFMASRLACELNHRIAAVAVVAASMDDGVGYEPRMTMPIMYIQGTVDPLVPFQGGLMNNDAGGNIYSHRDILKTWAAIDSCNNNPVTTYPPSKVDDGTSVVKEVYSNPNGLKVVGYTIVGGGHTWPGGSQYLPKFVIGPVSKNLDACEEIGAFFKGNRLAAIN